MHMAKAIVLFSGGLDSLLAYKILEAQGVDVTAVFFETHFFKRTKAQDIAEANNLKFRVETVGDEHLEVVKDPKFGRGKQMNPCIDCHLFMIRKAKEIMEAEGFDFIASGEVMGQRPMSQNPDALRKIEKEAGLTGKLLRPLSAKLLDPTEAEEKGIVDREKLFSFQGRGRKAQLQLVKQFGIKKFQSPAGGCVLTEKEFSKNLSDLSDRWPDFNGNDISLILCGRVFWEENVLIVVCRNSDECKKLKDIALAEDILIELVDVSGPSTLVRVKEFEDSAIEKAIELTIRYASKAQDLDIVKVKIKRAGEEEIREIKK